MATEAETEIIVDEPQAQVEVEGEKPRAEARSAVTTADEGIEDLKGQIARSRADSDRRLSEANRIIQETRARVVAAENEVVTVRKDAVSTLVDSLKQEKESAKRDLRLAQEAGEHDKAAEAYDRISMANARLVEAEKGKLDLDAVKPAAVAQPARQIHDPVDQMARAAEEGGGHRSAQWIRSHPEFARDPGKWADVESAHYAALAERIKPETDEYFEFVDGRLGINGKRAEPARETREPSRAPTSAPVSRQSTQTPGTPRTGVIRLTKAEAATAMETIGVLHPNMAREEIYRKYAANRDALVSEGKMTRREA